MHSLLITTRWSALFLLAGPVLHARAAVVIDPPPPSLNLGHTAPLTAVAYSADGRTVVSLDASREVRWRYAATGAPQLTKQLPEASGMARLARDGSLLTAGPGGVVNWWRPPAVGKPLALWRTFGAPPLAPTPAELTKPDAIIVTATLPYFALTSDGRWLVTLNIENSRANFSGRGTNAALVRIWSVADGALRHALDAIPFEQVPPVVGVAPNGETLLVAYPDHSVNWLDIATGAMQKKWQPPDAAAQKAEDGDAEAERRLSKLPESMRSHIPKNRRARLEAELQKPEHKFGQALAFSPDGSHLLSSTLLGYKVWDLVAGTANLLEKSAGLPSPGPLFSPDGSLVAQASGPGFEIWETTGAQRIRELVPPGQFTGLAFSPDSRSLALADNRARVHIYGTGAGAAEPKVLPGFFEPWRQIVAGGNGMVLTTSDAVARVSARGVPQWVLVEPIQSPEPPPAALRTVMNLLSISPDGTLQAEAVYFTPYYAHLEDKNIPKGELRVRDLTTNKILWREADNGRGALSNLVWLPDNSLLFGKQGFSASVRFVAETLASFQRRDGKTGEQKPLGITWGNKRGLDEPGGVESLAAAADGSRVEVGDGNGARILDMRAGSVLRFLDNGVSRGIRFSMSADGHWLAGGTRDGRVLLYDLNRDRKDYDNAADIRLQTGDAAAVVRSTAFGADGTLVAGLADGRVLAWKPEFVKDAAPQWETAATGSAITALSFDRIGSHVWSGDERGELTQRDVATGALHSALRLRPSRPGTAPYDWTRWNSTGKVQVASP